PLGVAAKCFADGGGELGRLRGLDADQGHRSVAQLEANLDAVGGVRIDNHAVALRYMADGRDALGVSAGAGDQSGGLETAPVRRVGKIEAAVAAEFLPQGAHDA